MIINVEPIPGSSRQRVKFDDGTVLERSTIYLESHQWENLKRLSALQGTSGSKLIGRLIDLATTFKQR